MGKTYDDYIQKLQEYDKIWDESNSERLSPKELIWIEYQPWLASRGYILRPRFHPGWVPSWRGTEKSRFSCEDGQSLDHGHIMDATRISDGVTVALKMIFRSIHPFEAEIGQYFSSQALASEPGNHCIPIFEVLAVPEYDDMQILVMPFLRDHDRPRFETIGEAVEFFRQVFDGLQFMHAHHVAHRDCSGLNVMMDTTRLYPKGFHPIQKDRKRNFRGSAIHYTRTERPPKYYLTDFGLSRRYDPKDGPSLELPIRGGDKTVPEFQGQGYYEYSDPFATDIYYIANMIKMEFLEPNVGFEFMSVLIADMTKDDPFKRPTIDQVVAQFTNIFSSLTTTQLRARIVHRKELTDYYMFLRWARNYIHFCRRIRFLLRRIPPVPRQRV